MIAALPSKQAKIRVLTIPGTGGFVMTELRPTNVIGVLRAEREGIALFCVASDSRTYFKDDSRPSASGVGCAVGPPR